MRLSVGIFLGLLEPYFMAASGIRLIRARIWLDFASIESRLFLASTWDPQMMEDSAKADCK